MKARRGEVYSLYFLEVDDFNHHFRNKKELTKKKRRQKNPDIHIIFFFFNSYDSLMWKTSIFSEKFFVLSFKTIIFFLCSILFPRPYDNLSLDLICKFFRYNINFGRRKCNLQREFHYYVIGIRFSLRNGVPLSR